MSIVIYTNQKNGCRYAYESTAQWDPVAKQSRPKRKYLGRVDENGNIIQSTHKRGGARVKKETVPGAEAAPDTAAAPSATIEMQEKTAAAPISRGKGEDPTASVTKSELSLEQKYSISEKERLRALGEVQALKRALDECRRQNQKLQNTINRISELITNG